MWNNANVDRRFAVRMIDSSRSVALTGSHGVRLQSQPPVNRTVRRHAASDPLPSTQTSSTLLCQVGSNGEGRVVERSCKREHSH